MENNKKEVKKILIRTWLVAGAVALFNIGLERYLDRMD